jgi:hypothetical protein
VPAAPIGIQAHQQAAVHAPTHNIQLTTPQQPSACRKASKVQQLVKPLVKLEKKGKEGVPARPACLDSK